MNGSLKKQKSCCEMESKKYRKAGGQGAAVALLLIVMGFAAITAAGPDLGIDADVGAKLGTIGENIGIGDISEYAVTWWQVLLVSVVLTIAACYVLRYKAEKAVAEDKGTIEEKAEEQTHECGRRISVGG